MVHADGSIIQTFNYLRQHGLQGFVDIWPRPTVIAWKIIACYAAFEAALQLLLPGKRVEGPISPTGNQPVYKVSVARYCLLQNILIYTCLLINCWSNSKSKKFLLLNHVACIYCMVYISCCFVDWGRQMVWQHME